MNDLDPFADDPDAGGDASGDEFVEGRVVSGEDVELAPLYPTSRLLRAATFEAEELKEQARRLVEDAEQRAADLVSKAEHEARARIAAARAEEGKIRAAAADAARNEVVEQWSNLVVDFNRAVGDYHRRLPEWVRDTSFRLAKHILAVEFTARPERILEFVDRAMQKARRQSSISICLHPDDFALVEPLKAELQEKHGLESPPTVIESDEVPRHSVRIETGVSRAAYHIGIDELFEELRRQIDKKLQ